MALSTSLNQVLTLAKRMPRTSHLADLAMRWLQVENRREISSPDAAVSEEMIRLSNSWRFGAEKVVSAYFIAMCASCSIVFLVVRIHD